MKRMLSRIRIAWAVLRGKPVELDRVKIPFKVVRVGAHDESKLQTWHLCMTAVNQEFRIQLVQDKEKFKAARLQAALKGVKDPRELLL